MYGVNAPIAGMRVIRPFMALLTYSSMFDGTFIDNLHRVRFLDSKFDLKC